MSYSTINALVQDPLFQGRVRACSVEQAQIFKDDARPDFVALANDLLRGDLAAVTCFIRLTAGAPGLGDAAESGPGDGIDQSNISDADILSSVQVTFPTVAALYYDAEGNPIGGT
jgi:hypothetical protein